MFQPTTAPSGVGASVCVRTSGCRQRHQPHLARRPLLGRSQPPSAIPPSVRPSEATPSASHRAWPLPLPLPICLHAAVRACVLGASLSLWMVGCSRSPVPATSSIQRGGQAGRQAGPPSLLSSSLPLARALRFGESVFQPLASAAAAAAACPPTAACNGRTQTVTRWQPLSLVVSQVPLRSAIWCSESDHLTRGKKFARRRRQRDATQTQDFVLRRTATALRTSGRG